MSLGPFGKLLPTAFAVGLPIHAGSPNAGLNQAVLADLLHALARRMLYDEGRTESGEGRA